MVKAEADESGIELVVSIPICYEDHQFDNIPLGRRRCLCDDMESTSSMDSSDYNTSLNGNVLVCWLGSRYVCSIVALIFLTSGQYVPLWV